MSASNMNTVECYHHVVKHRDILESRVAELEGVVRELLGMNNPASMPVPKARAWAREVLINKGE